LNSIFWTALDIAWSDGSMSKKGALIIEKLHDAMGLKTSLREEIEDEFARVVLENRTERGEGKGDAELEIWVNEVINDLNSNDLEEQIICLGSKAVKQGLSKEKWIAGMNFTDEFNQSNTFAEGVWMENDSKNQFKDYLSILQPLENDLNSN